jgi:hypothetical protein
MDARIHLTFTPQQLDYIANVLAARPYSEVQALLADIGRQVAQQNADNDAPRTPKPDAGQQPVVQ